MTGESSRPGADSARNVAEVVLYESGVALSPVSHSTPFARVAHPRPLGVSSGSRVGVALRSNGSSNMSGELLYTRTSRPPCAEHGVLGMRGTELMSVVAVERDECTVDEPECPPRP
jgi:hypothetical protein